LGHRIAALGVPALRGPASIDQPGRYTLPIRHFLLTGGEANLGFLTRQNRNSDITDLRDVRMAVIDEMKRAGSD
jgi:hypothetical protein